MSELAGTRFVVVGLGPSGRAAVEVLDSLGAHVLGLDRSEAAVDAARRELGPRVRLTAVPDDDALADVVLGSGARVAVVTLGAPPVSALLTRAAAGALECWSELELAWQVQRATTTAPDWLLLTGTGATTTVGMLGAILTAAGLRAPAVGDGGAPVVQVAAEGRADVLAAAVSSSQLHLTRSVAPLASACLDIATDRHSPASRANQARVYERTRGACVYSGATTRTMVERADVAEGARAVGTVLGAPGLGELGIVEDVLCDRAFEPRRQTAAAELATLADLAHLAPAPDGELPVHLVSCALVAAALARARAVPAQAVAAGLRAYRGETGRPVPEALARHAPELPVTGVVAGDTGDVMTDPASAVARRARPGAAACALGPA